MGNKLDSAWQARQLYRTNHLNYLFLPYDIGFHQDKAENDFQMPIPDLCQIPYKRYSYYPYTLAET